MRNRVVFAAILFVGTAAFVTAGGTQVPAAAPQHPTVFVAIYERGPAWDASKNAFEQTSIPEHRQFLAANADRLVGFAPFQQGVAPGSTDKTVGMVIILAATQEDAQKFVAGDPGITSGVMKTTVRRWMVDKLKAY